MPANARLRNLSKAELATISGPSVLLTLRRTANLHTMGRIAQRHTMKLTRSSRVLAACLTLFCLLFTQLALAAYVCPNQTTAPRPVEAKPAPMADCQEMGSVPDTEQPGLCKAHCASEKQSPDTTGAPQVQAFVPAGLVLVMVDAASRHAPALHSGAVSLTRTTAPPVAIRHCCFRI